MNCYNSVVGIQSFDNGNIGENCEGTMNIRRSQEIEVDAFVDLDKDTLIQIGKS